MFEQKVEEKVVKGDYRELEMDYAEEIPEETLGKHFSKINFI